MRARAADDGYEESGCAECGCVEEEEEEMGIDRTRHGNLSALGR